MSQMVTRKRTGGDEKEKRQTDSPAKDMKKKMAANAEKEKNATEKPADTAAEKPAEKSTEKPVDKSEKHKQAEKAPEKPAEKKNEKAAEKKSDAQSEKKKEEGKAENSGKTDKPEKKPDARDSQKPKQNGSSNGVNGTVSGAGDSDSDELVIDENDENDELFPELAYDDSDAEWEPGADAPSRSLTRRSQSKDSKVLKLTQESGKTSDSPKPEPKKSEPKTDAKKPEPKPDPKKPETAKDAKPDSPKPEAKKPQEAKESPKEGKKEEKESPRKEKGEKGDKSDKVEVEVIVEIESGNEPSEEQRKPDTNYSKSRVKVSPYRRSTRLADLTTSSVTANYTGNNTTMEMDITESSSLMDATLDDSSYLSGLRSIRGRRSYKLLGDVTLRGAGPGRSARAAGSAADSARPTGTVVGRKRKPDAEAPPADEPEEPPAAGKRQRLVERLARPFRRTALLPARRNAEIVGINTDLPLSAPVASAAAAPEALKAAPAPLAPLAPHAPRAAPEDSKRCVLM